MAKVSFSANPRPSGMLKTHLKHQGNVSEGSERREIAKRTMLGRTVRFYNNGEHIIEITNIDEEEQFNSELLRFAHASILINAEVGDRRLVAVDATCDPVKIWMYGQTAEQFLRSAALCLGSGEYSTDQVIYDTPEGNIRRQKELIL